MYILNKKKVKFICGHEFCKGCIRKWKMKNMTCPCCRGLIVNDKQDMIKYIQKFLKDISFTESQLDKIKIIDRMF